MSQNIDPRALFALGYGLYVVTTNDGVRDNGLIVNTVSQVALSPDRIMVAVSKQNYSHDTIRATGKLCVNCLTEDAPFSVFEAFGFQSGRDTDKFADCTITRRTASGLVVLPKYTNAFLSLSVTDYIDLGTHGMFLCTVDESEVLADAPSMTYAYYHANVKPKPQAPAAKTETPVYVCTICGYRHEGELPADFICPWCKHPATDFEREE